MKYILIILLFLALISCKKDEDDVKMPDSCKTIYQNFCSQGGSRGHKFKFKRLKEIVLQGNISEQQCTSTTSNTGGYYDHETKKIYLDTTGVDWLYNKEALIDHELGHALLNREHRNTLFIDNQTPVSIMHYSLMAALNTMTDSYYYDELFNENTPYPYWVKDWK